MFRLYLRRMKGLHLIGLIALLSAGIILLTSYLFIGRKGESLGVYLLAGAMLPLALIPFFIYVLHASEKLARKSLKELKSQLIPMMDAIEQGIIVIDEHSFVEFLNNATAKMFGFFRSEVEGNKLSMLIPDMDYVLHGCSFDVLFGDIEQDNVLDAYEVKGRHSSGDSFALSLTARKVNLEDKTVFILLLHEKLKLEKTEKIKDEFVSTVSHEIRTPLTSILGALGIVSGGMAGEIPEEAKKIIDIANRNCQGLISLVNNILDLSRLESDIHKFRLRPVRLLPILQQAVEDLQPYAEQFNVSLHSVEGREGPVVMGREEQLRQVVTNLVSNAIKYSPPDDTVEVSLDCTGGTVRVSVQDHGPGVPEAFRERIFQKFAQADSSDSRSRGGTGLGLNISKKIIEKLGGRIGYYSVPWSETIFYFELSEVREEAPAIPVEFDEVTSLMMRTGFDRELDKEWRRGGRVRSHMSLIFLEVDDLNMYEEMYGVGSRADSLKRIAGAVSGTLKRAGDIVARYNDDTFAVLLADTDLKGSVFVAEKIRSRINELHIEFVLPQRSGHITASQGIASVVPERMTTPDGFVDAARKALLDARAAGGDVVRYHK